MKRKILSKVLAVGLAVLTLITTLTPTLAIETDNTVSTASESVKITKGQEYTYEANINWSTHYMEANGVVAYCIDPSLPSKAGTYAISQEITNQKIKKAVYYGYKGVAFEKPISVFGNTSMKSFMNTQKNGALAGSFR